MSSNEDSATQCEIESSHPADIGAVLYDIAARSNCVQAALLAVNERIASDGPASNALKAWEATSDLLEDVSFRFRNAARVLEGTAPLTRASHQTVDQTRLQDNLSAHVCILSAWLSMEQAKLKAISPTVEIWNSILSRQEQMSSVNRAMFAEFEAERSGLEEATRRLIAAIQYLRSDLTVFE